MPSGNPLTDNRRQVYRLAAPLLILPAVTAWLTPPAAAHEEFIEEVVVKGRRLVRRRLAVALLSGSGRASDDPRDARR